MTGRARFTQNSLLLFPWQSGAYTREDDLVLPGAAPHDGYDHVRCTHIPPFSFLADFHQAYLLAMSLRLYVYPPLQICGKVRNSAQGCPRCRAEQTFSQLDVALSHPLPCRRAWQRGLSHITLAPNPREPHPLPRAPQISLRWCCGWQRPPRRRFPAVPEESTDRRELSANGNRHNPGYTAPRDEILVPPGQLQRRE